MSLIYDYSICPNGCNSVHLSDLTGAFDATLNPGGFWISTGTNPSVANVATCSLEVIFPDGHVVTIDVLDLVLPFPNTNSALEKTIPYSSLGLSLGAKLPNGIYKTKITVGGTNTHNSSVPFTTSASKDLFITCKAWCCVAKLFVAAAQESGCTPCFETKMAIAKATANKLIGAENAFNCGDYVTATFVLQQVEDTCSQNGCSDC